MSIQASDLVTTIGGASSNSYVTLAVFNTYCEQRLNVDAFDDAQAGGKIRALLMATRRLDRENWTGQKAATTQALTWPRSGVYIPDGSGYQYTSTEIPQLVKDAQCELALAYLDGFDDGAEDAIDSFSADGVSVKFRREKLSSGLPVAVTHLIGGLTRGNRLVRA